jgi:hypothetical protein
LEAGELVGEPVSVDVLHLEQCGVAAPDDDGGERELRQSLQLEGERPVGKSRGEIVEALALTAARTAEDLMRTYGLTAEQAGDGSPDLVWLLKEGKGDAYPYSTGDRLPVGVEAFPGQKPNDMVLWIESHAAVNAGDTLVDFGDGLHINPRWLRPDVTREQVVEGLRPLLELPVETCSRRTAAPSTGPPLSARSPDRRPADVPTLLAESVRE